MFVIKLFLILLINIVSAQECVNICSSIPIEQQLVLDPTDQITNEIIKLQQVKEYINRLNLHVEQLSNLNLDIKYLDELIQIQKNIKYTLNFGYEPELDSFSKASIQLFKRYQGIINNFLINIRQFKNLKYKINYLVKQYGNESVIDDKITKLLIKQITMYDNNINELL
jgi:hypothetical protein